MVNEVTPATQDPLALPVALVTLEHQGLVEMLDQLALQDLLDLLVH